MAQGAVRQRKGKQARLSKVMKSKQMKKGGRNIKPKKQRAVMAVSTNKLLTKQISLKIEKTMKARAGGIVPLKMLKSEDEKDKAKSKSSGQTHSSAKKLELSAVAKKMNSSLTAKLANSRKAKSTKAFSAK